MRQPAPLERSKKVVCARLERSFEGREAWKEEPPFFCAMIVDLALTKKRPIDSQSRSFTPSCKRPYKQPNVMWLDGMVPENYARAMIATGRCPGP